MMGSRGHTTIQMRPSRQQRSRWRLQQRLATGRLGSMGHMLCTTAHRYGAPKGGPALAHITCCIPARKRRTCMMICVRATAREG